ncbi:MAG: hypothetical protein IKF49_04645 [Clostridia bacterium]|nr:hypothetical protein [Clostridia bacterium]
MAKKQSSLDRKINEFSRVTFLDENGRPKSAAWLYSFLLAILYALLYIAVFIGAGFLLGRWMPASLLAIPFQYILTAVIGSIPCVALFFVFKQHKAYVVGAYIWLAVLMLLMIPATLLMSDWKEGYGWTDMWMFCIYLFFPAILSIGLGGTSAYLLYRKHVLDEEAKVEAKNRPSYYNT